MMGRCSLALLGAIFRQADFAERESRTLLGPVDRGIVNSVTVLGQPHGYTKSDGPLATRSLISSKRKFGLRAAASVSPRYSLPATGSTRYRP